MSFPLNPVQNQTTIQNGIKYVYSTATNSWRRDYNNLINRLTIAGDFTSTNTSTGALIVYSGAGIGGNLNVGGKLVVWNTATNTGTTSLNALYVKGGVGIDKDLVVNGDTLFIGNVTFIGSSTVISSIQTAYTDHAIILHDSANTSTWTFNDGKDIGLLLHYYDTEDSYSFLGRDNNTGYLEWLNKGAGRLDNSFTGTYGTMKLGSIILTDTTTSVNYTTGALQVAGGVGIAGDLFVNGTISAVNVGFTTTATNLAGGNRGSIPYQISTGTTGFIGIGSSGTVLISNGMTATWEIFAGNPLTLINDTSTNNTFYPLFVNTTTGQLTTVNISTDKLSWNPSTGILSAVDLNSTSDIREKDNLFRINDPISLLKQIDGYQFTWKNSERKSYGVVAQYLETILPELVSEDTRGMKSVRYLPLIAILIEGIKELSSQLEEIKKTFK